MKKILIFLWCGVLLTGCFDNETIHADYVDYGRIYDTTSTDPVLKYISQYYYKLEKILIIDPDTSDYMFNFQMKHKVHIVEPRQEETHLLKGLKFVEDLFFNGYRDDVKKNLFPYAIILADSIYNTSSKKYVDIYTTTYYIAFLVNDEMLNRSEEEKEEISRNWNSTFLNYCTNKIGWTVPEEFYLYSDAEYGKKENWFITGVEEGDIDAVWERGYPIGKWDWNFDENWNRVYGYSVSSSRAGYLEKFLEFLFTTPQETINKAIQAHEKLKNAHDILDQALKDDFGIDYRTMIYKAKK